MDEAEVYLMAEMQARDPLDVYEVVVRNVREVLQQHGITLRSVNMNLPKEGTISEVTACLYMEAEEQDGD